MHLIQSGKFMLVLLVAFMISSCQVTQAADDPTDREGITLLSQHTKLAKPVGESKSFLCGTTIVEIGYSTSYSIDRSGAKPLMVLDDVEVDWVKIGERENWDHVKNELNKWLQSTSGSMPIFRPQCKGDHVVTIYVSRYPADGGKALVFAVKVE